MPGTMSCASSNAPPHGAPCADTDSRALISTLRCVYMSYAHTLVPLTSTRVRSTLASSKLQSSARSLHSTIPFFLFYKQNTRGDAAGSMATDMRCLACRVGGRSTSRRSRTVRRAPAYACTRVSLPPTQSSLGSRTLTCTPSGTCVTTQWSYGASLFTSTCAKMLPVDARLHRWYTGSGTFVSTAGLRGLSAYAWAVHQDMYKRVHMSTGGEHQDKYMLRLSSQSCV